MRKEIKTVLMFLILGLAASAWADEKIYDPMDVFKRDVPPNILVVVDNSGSMNKTVNSNNIMDYRYKQAVWPATGDYWHFNLPGQTDRWSWYNYDTVPSEWLVTSEDIESADLSQSRTASLSVSQSGTVSFVAIGVDLFVEDGVNPDDQTITITLTSPDGTTIQITPSMKWYAIRKSDGMYGSSNQDTKVVGGTWVPGHYEWYGWYRYWVDGYYEGGTTYYRYRVKHAFPDFEGGNKAGTWTVTAVSGSNGASILLDSVYLSFDPLLSKMTILKHTLQKVIATSKSARFAFGSYKANWRNKQYPYGADGIPSSYPNRYGWVVDSNDPGTDLLVGFPSDPLDTNSNRNDILDWVGLDNNASEFGDNPVHELMANGYTPLSSCTDDITGIISDEANSDPSKSCRSYSVILLTDGYCTQRHCKADDIKNHIKATYEAHKVTKPDGTVVGTKTYVIGFAMGTNSTKLNAYAHAGHTDGNPNVDGDQAYMPDDADSLLQVFKDAIAQASVQTFTGETQVIPVKLNPDLQNKKDSNGNPYLVWQDQIEDSIIQSFFTYSNGDGFKGHLRAYGILKPDGTLLGNAQYRPIWDVSDWSETLRDDQGQPLSSEPVNRRGTIDERIDHIKAYITPDPTESNDVGSTSAKVPFRESFRCIVTPDSASNGSSLVYLNAYSYRHKKHRYKPSHQLISFVKDRTGIEKNSEAVEFIDFLQTKTMGDSTYSTPAIIGAPDSHYPDDTYNAFVNAHKDREKVIYIGANDGMLHCLDAHTGDELWAFIPYDLFPRLMNIFNEYKLTGDKSGQPDPKGASTDPLGRKPHYYYLASSPRYTDIKDSQGHWMTILTIGEGGGGNAYTTLNVTNPTISGFDDDFYPGNDPETPDDAMDNPSRINLAYTIDNGNDLYLWSTASSSQFSDMGETWSTPSYTRYDKDNFVGYFGSGYPGYGGSGSTLYAVDLSNGEMLDSKQIDSGRSIMCSPGALVGGDNTVYAVYFGDTKGGLWRYVPDMNGINSLGNSHMDKIFQSMYGTTIFDTPALLLDSSGVVWISTGEMGSEAGGSVVDDSVLYTVKDGAGYDQHPAPVITPSDMMDMNAFESVNGVNKVVSLDEAMDPNSKGYFYQLPVRETLFTSPIITGYTLNELAYTTTLYLTYRYPQQGNYCSLGESNLYIFGLASMFIADEEGDNNGANLVGEGKPGSPFESEAGDIWLNTPSGPVRVVNAQGEGLGTGSASQDVDAQTLGKSGGWYTK